MCGCERGRREGASPAPAEPAPPRATCRPRLPARPGRAFPGRDGWPAGGRQARRSALTAAPAPAPPFPPARRPAPPPGTGGRRRLPPPREGRRPRPGPAPEQRRSRREPPARPRPPSTRPQSGRGWRRRPGASPLGSHRGEGGGGGQRARRFSAVTPAPPSADRRCGGGHLPAAAATPARPGPAAEVPPEAAAAPALPDRPCLPQLPLPRGSSPLGSLKRVYGTKGVVVIVRSVLAAWERDCPLAFQKSWITSRPGRG